MPTLEEELEVLKSALSLLQSRHISDVKQLGERINTLQQQIDEQKRRASEQGQSTHKRFDSLEKALPQQFAIVNQSFLRLEQQGRQQTDEIKAKFETSDHFAARTWGVVQEQERDIRTTREDVQTILGRFEQVDQHFETLEQRINGRFDTQDEKFDQVLHILTTSTTKPQQET